MSDIIERLRNYEVQDLGYGATKNLEALLKDAADEIERLRKESIEKSAAGRQR